MSQVVNGLQAAILTFSILPSLSHVILFSIHIIYVYGNVFVAKLKLMQDSSMVDFAYVSKQGWGTAFAV